MAKLCVRRAWPGSDRTRVCWYIGWAGRGPADTVEDEDDVVPDQHAAFGIQRATQTKKEPTWRDLGLEELLRRGPMGIGGGSGSGSAVAAGGSGIVGQGREEPVRLALARQPGARMGVRVGNGSSESSRSGGSGAAGNGLPR